jgi:serine/threonine-protein kinase RsbW
VRETPTLEMSIEGQADSAGLESIHAVLEQFWSTGPNVEEAWRMMFETALAEIAANMVEHSSVEGRITSLRLRLRAFSDRVEARLQDDGPPVDTQVDRQLPDEHATRGRGLAIVRSMVDEFSYSREEEMNGWQIVKELPRRLE